MITRQQAREQHGVSTTVYRKDFKLFESPGLVKLVVKCPKTFVVRESKWVAHELANEVFDRLVHEVIIARMSLPPPPKPVRFHQPFDF